jgi:hypothetical protein
MGNPRICRCGSFGLPRLSERRIRTEINDREKAFKFNSLFGQAGAGLKYKISNRVDIEGRLMYVITGDDEFDGGGDQYSAVNRISSHTTDNFFNATLGLTVNLVKMLTISCGLIL